MPMNCMVDIETAGQRFDAPILSIGAVFFDPDTGEIGKEFYQDISPDSALNYGRMSGSTFKWWMEQSDAARKAAVCGKANLPDVLRDFSSYYGYFPKSPIWGNGPSFDITILEHGLARCQIPLPWDFWNIRDCRTMKELGDAIGYKIPKLKGVAHNALDDARHQAMWVSEIRRLLLKTKVPAAKKAYVKPVESEEPDIDLDDI